MRNRTIYGQLYTKFLQHSAAEGRHSPENRRREAAVELLQWRCSMLQVLADRFVRRGRVWIDLATGELARVRITHTTPPSSHQAWSSRCSTLSNLRHPGMNALIDYGTADREHRFEAYGTRPPLRTSARAAERLIAHARRFLEAHEIEVTRDDLYYLIRPFERGRAVCPQAIGLRFQHRQLFDVVKDALEDSNPAGPSGVCISGAPDSGLRTTRLLTARIARLRGYVVASPASLRIDPLFAEFLCDRHVCILGDEDTLRDPAVRSLLMRLAVRSARRHVVITFVREPVGADPAVAIDPMGVSAMTEMIYLDSEQPPTAAEVVAAAHAARGRPGLCLARLGACEYDVAPSRPLVVHELPQTYAPDLDVAVPLRDARIALHAGLFDRVLAGAEALRRRGRHASAQRSLSRAVRVLVARGARDQAARASILRGSLAFDRGDLDAAAKAFEQARGDATLPDIAIEASIGLAETRVQAGRLTDAEALLRATLLACTDTHRVLRTRAATVLARCLFWGARLDEAMVAIGHAADDPACSASAEARAMRARVLLAQGAIPDAVRACRSARQLAAQSNEPRALAEACRVLAAAVASAGDEPSALLHAGEGLAAAASAHLPLASAQLRLTLAEIHSSCDPLSARRTVARIAGHHYPPLLKAWATAVLCRMSGRDLDSRTLAFMNTSGAFAIAQPSIVRAPNPVADLEALLELAHSASDDRGAMERITAELQNKLRASTIVVVGITPERRVLYVCGRPWHGDPLIAWRTAGAALTEGVNLAIEPYQAAEPVRYCGDIIGAIAARWTAGTAIDAPRTTALLRVGALALSANVRAILDRSTPPSTHACGDLVGESEQARSLREAIIRAARAPFPVLIQGESGSGKELVARAVHRLGARRERRFCALNCAALSDELIEAELFGHSRGAFTGAVSERGGLFEESDGGTLFLDEIGELSARAQAKLLRVLQDGEVRRVGENISRRVDVRIIAATNRRLEQETAAGRFRADLRFRLDVVRIEVPPLRDRSSDVPLLASRFWNDAAGRVGSHATLAPDALAALARYDWPGNVRELQNVIAWIAVQSPRRGRIGSAALPRHVAEAGVSQTTTFEAAREEFERRFVKAALAAADGQRSRAAEALGMTRQGLAKMMRRLGIE